ncbi:hypothetical protein HDV02_005293 [Globomyces sp. JEL0801]|nr:hypothetical protein HDV02_005293 [Globomyces sp. JEL0801]
MKVVIAWNWYVIAVSFMAAIFGAFTAIEVISHLLKLLIQRKLSKGNASTKSYHSQSVKSPNPEGSTTGSVDGSNNSNESTNFLSGMSDDRVTFMNMFIAAVALGACGIWDMHFIGIYALKVYTIPTGNYVPGKIHVGYTLVSLVICILSVFFGLCTSSWAFGLFRTGLSLNRTGAKTNATEKIPVKDSRAVVENGDDSAVSSPTSVRPTTRTVKTVENTLMKKFMKRMKVQDDATKYLREFSFFSLSIRDRIVFIFGGILTGLGVAGMHYTGMASLRVPNVNMKMNPVFMVASIVIASVVATVGLYILFFIRGKNVVLISSIVIAVAVCGMHYTAVYGIVPEYVKGYNVASTGWELEGFEIELLIAHLAFTCELSIVSYVHQYLRM